MNSAKVLYPLLLCSFFCIDKTNPEGSGYVPVKSFAFSEVVQVASAKESGMELYSKYCLACHQTDGSGVPNMYPPLKTSDWVNGDQTKLIKLLLNGMSGEIQVNEEYYDQTMPKVDYLTDEQISEVLTYVRQNFGNKALPVSPKDVLALRNVK